MPTKKHEELRGFAHRILSYMGITDIYNEESINITLPDGTEKKYRIDVVGYAKYKYKESELPVLIEVGTNNFDKINNLRIAGYMVIVIPYSEKEEEFQDERKLLEIMIKSNSQMRDTICKLVCQWSEILDKKIELIDENNQKINQANKKIEELMIKLSKAYDPLKQFQEVIKEINIPYVPEKFNG